MATRLAHEDDNELCYFISNGNEKVIRMIISELRNQVESISYISCLSPRDDMISDTDVLSSEEHH